MAYTIKEVREWNAALKSRLSNLVAVFVGGTSGIGEQTARRLASVIDQPTIYILGRNELAGARVVEDLKTANPKGSYAFMRTDASQLREVDTVCNELKAREKTLDLLFLSPGALAFSKQETEAKIDVNHLLRYYSRMRFIYNLLPLLKAAESPRVISILAGGKEVTVDEDNLDLRKQFSLSASNGYPATMTSLAFELLAAQNPTVSFIHEFPGFVATPILKNSMGPVLGTILSFLLKPMSISAEESGEWQVFLSTYPGFPAKNSADADAAAEKGIKITQASTGEVGGGAYILTHDGRDSTNSTLMTQLREKGLPDILLKHTQETFDRILS